MSNKRDLKAMFKDMQKFTSASLSQKQSRVQQNNTGKIKIPYKMLQGMRNKSLERDQKQKNQDKQSQVVGSSGRDTKLMHNYFVKSH
jgi:membrane protease subunit (stomatin/prohibitin family)